MAARSRTTPAYWQRETGKFEPFKIVEHPFGSILKRYLPVDPTKSCVEVGAYPGANLGFLAKYFGFKSYAIEYREDADDIKHLFEFNSLTPPIIFNSDFLTIEQRQFDIVTSYGFVEHFDDPKAVLQKHVDILAADGYLVISVPHFWGMQGLFRRLVFTKEALDELFATHNLDIMHLRVLRNILKDIGLTVIYNRYVMNGKFWISANSPKVRPSRRWLAKLLIYFDKLIGSHIPSCFLVSPMILIICRKAYV